jgi:hypothetical protein
MNPEMKPERDSPVSTIIYPSCLAFLHMAKDGSENPGLTDGIKARNRKLTEASAGRRQPQGPCSASARWWVDAESTVGGWPECLGGPPGIVFAGSLHAASQHCQFFCFPQDTSSDGQSISYRAGTGLPKVSGSDWQSQPEKLLSQGLPFFNPVWLGLKKAPPPAVLLHLFE